FLTSLYSLLFFLLMRLRPPSSTLFPYTTLFRSLNISSPGWAKHAWSCFFAPWNAGATIFIHNYARFDAKRTLSVKTSVVVDENGDRKSTRLNSSHRTISYAVFCLKKKNKQ